MKTTIEIIPEEFLLLRQEYLALLLDHMPVVRSGRRGLTPVLRVYKDSRRYREISSTNSDWKDAMELYNKRLKIVSSLTQTKKLLAGIRRRKGFYSIQAINKDNRLDNEFFDSLADSSCTFEKNSEYYYKGYNFRSRSEMQFAAILDEFGLEYKYDVRIAFSGKTLTVDFVIVFREFNRCVFIEYFGRCQDHDYNGDNSRKLLYVQNDGVYIGRDYFIMSGDKSYTPGPDVMRNVVASIIAQLASEHIKIVEAM